MLLHPVRFPRYGLVLGAVGLLILGAAPASAPPPDPVRRSVCTADPQTPLRVEVEREDPVRPGLPVGATVRLTAARVLDGVTVRYRPQAGVNLASPAAWNPGRLRRGEVQSERFTVIAPSDRRRRTVEVEVEYSVDGVRFTQGAALNLVFEEEPSRVVTTPDGRRVREVAARRVG